jgi:hypothetical protein
MPSKDSGKSHKPSTPSDREQLVTKERNPWWKKSFWKWFFGTGLAIIITIILFNYRTPDLRLESGMFLPVKKYTLEEKDTINFGYDPELDCNTITKECETIYALNLLDREGKNHPLPNASTFAELIQFGRSLRLVQASPERLYSVALRVKNSGTGTAYIDSEKCLIRMAKIKYWLALPSDGNFVEIGSGDEFTAGIIKFVTDLRLPIPDTFYFQLVIKCRPWNWDILPETTDSLRIKFIKGPGFMFDDNPDHWKIDSLIDTDKNDRAHYSMP